MDEHNMKWDPGINMGQVITWLTSMAASLVFVLVSWATMDKRVTILEENKTAATQQLRDQQATVNEKFSDVKGTLQEIKSSVEYLRRDVQQQQAQRSGK